MHVGTAFEDATHGIHEHDFKSLIPLDEKISLDQDIDRLSCFARCETNGARGLFKVDTGCGRIGHRVKVGRYRFVGRFRQGNREGCGCMASITFYNLGAGDLNGGQLSWICRRARVGRARVGRARVGRARVGWVGIRGGIRVRIGGASRNAVEGNVTRRGGRPIGDETNGQVFSLV